MGAGASAETTYASVEEALAAGVPQADIDSYFASIEKSKQTGEEQPKPSGDEWKKLHSACRWNKFDDVVTLLKSVDVNAKDDGNGNTAAHIASQNGNLQLVELLITNSCDVNTQNGNGLTALHMAMEYDYYKVAQALIAAGAKTDALNNNGHPAIKGIDGKKIESMVALAELTASTEELMASLDKLIENPEGLDKVELVQTRMKKKKEKQAWTDEVDAKFKILLAKL